VLLTRAWGASPPLSAIFVPVAQQKSSRLLTGGSEVRLLPGIPRFSTIHFESVMQIELSRQFSISEFQSSDRHQMVENLRDGMVQQWTLLIPYPYGLEDANAWLKNLQEKKAVDGQAMNWAIRNPDGRAIGGIGFHDAGGHQGHVREIGYWLTKEYWGCGIMTDAVKAVVTHAFQHLSLSRITAAIFHGNSASAKVLKKAGFQLEAPLLKKCYLKNGQFIDAAIVSNFHPRSSAAEQPVDNRQVEGANPSGDTKSHRSSGSPISRGNRLKTGELPVRVLPGGP
jgi:[ribosomal protein S5]-alanine N-acetyltransferase